MSGASTRIVPWVIGLSWLGIPIPAVQAAAEVGRGEVFSVVELTFRGPEQGPADAPARDVALTVRFRHEGGRAEHTVLGFWDGDGRGAAIGNVFTVRFCPTQAGRWVLAAVESNARELDGQHQGDYVTASPSSRHGFWVVDDESPGRRWYRRSDGSHQYVIGNTHYSFLSGYRADGRPKEAGIAEDVARNAAFFKKLRFGLSGDYYPHPTEQPFLDDDGRPTVSGDDSHRPNPSWFRGRVDVAVREAFAHDLIADLILAGPDTEPSRSTLRASRNNGDPAPFLRYVAARYGSFPNVWICLANEYNIRTPRFPEAQIARFGRTIQDALPYPTPLSVHTTPSILWPREFDRLAPWAEHIIIQKKLRDLAPAADVVEDVKRGSRGGEPRAMPIVNDELSYQGAGDRHSEGDAIESHLGTFLGGGYGSTGYKPGNKTGHYFWGDFDPAEHTAADNLQWLRAVIDDHVPFWEMAPDLSIFEGLDPGSRGLARPGRAYVLGTDRARRGLVARLPPGAWTVTRHDAIARASETLTARASGRFPFDAPDSRAALFLFVRNGGPAASESER